MDIKQIKPDNSVIQLILIPVITLLLVVLGTMFYVLPTYNKYKDNQAAIAKQKQELSKLNAKLAILEQANESELDSELSEVRSAVPEQKNIPGVIAGLSRVAQENSVAIDGLQLKPGKVASDAASQEITMKVSIKGELKNVDAFLQKLASIRRLFGIQKFSGTSALSASGFITSLDLVFYTAPLPTKLGDSYSDPLPEIDSNLRKLIAQVAQYPVYTEGASGGIALPLASQAPVATGSAGPVVTPNPSTRASAAPTGTSSAIPR